MGSECRFIGFYITVELYDVDLGECNFIAFSPTRICLSMSNEFRLRHIYSINPDTKAMAKVSAPLKLETARVEDMVKNYFKNAEGVRILILYNTISLDYIR